jgi:two-component system, chemotaxis family, sensor kinase CheA
MDDLIGGFVSETQAGFDALSADLVKWEADPAARPPLDAVFRFVHSVKGNCVLLGLARLERLANAAETALAGARDSRKKTQPLMVHAIRVVIDRIAAIVDAIEAGESLPGADETRMIAALLPPGSPIPPTLKGTAYPRTRGSSVTTETIDTLIEATENARRARDSLASLIGDTQMMAGASRLLDDMSRRLEEINDGLIATRLHQVSYLFAGLDRMVADTAPKLNKQAIFHIDAEGGGGDRDTIEALRDPVLHIVRNALVHGIETPRVRARAGKSEVGRIEAKVRIIDDRLLVEIGDDGAGLKLDHLTRKAGRKLAGASAAELVFAPGMTTAKLSALAGRGVGLDIAKAAVTRLGGSIKIENNPGHGVRFTIDVPLTNAGQTSRRALSCLVVDDSRLMRAVCRTMLENLGHHVNEARNGAEALQYCLNQRPALVVIDWNMPVMSGVEFAAAVKSQLNGSAPKVLLCSTETAREKISHAMRAGADGYMMKPLNPEMIADRIGALGLR